MNQHTLEIASLGGRTLDLLEPKELCKRCLPNLWADHFGQPRKYLNLVTFLLKRPNSPNVVVKCPTGPNSFSFFSCIDHYFSLPCQLKTVAQSPSLFFVLLPFPAIYNAHVCPSNKAPLLFPNSPVVCVWKRNNYNVIWLFLSMITVLNWNSYSPERFPVVCFWAAIGSDRPILGDYARKVYTYFRLQVATGIKKASDFTSWSM